MSVEFEKKPHTWEEAAEHESKLVLAEYRDRVGRVQHKSLDALLDGHFEQLRAAVENGDKTWIKLQYAHVASVALIGYVAASNRPVQSVMHTVLETIASKQHDYGHENIAAFGSTGLVVRINDKLARLANLKHRKAANEPVLDTWLDIVGYCIVGRMWEAGTFSLPLAADLVHGPTTPGHPDYLGEDPVKGPFDREDLGEIRAIVEDTVTAGAMCNAWVRDVIDEMAHAARGSIRKAAREEIERWEREQKLFAEGYTRAEAVKRAANEAGLLKDSLQGHPQLDLP